MTRLMKIMTLLSMSLVAQAQKRKILCLHGGGGTALGMESSSIQNLVNELKGDYEFVYASGGYGGVNSRLWIPDPPSKDNPTTDPNIAEDSIAAIDAIVQDEGPFYGILGYSQGSAFVPVYLSSLSDPAETFKIAVMFCGYVPTTHLGLVESIDDKSPFGDIESLVWMGAQDTIISNQMTKAQATKFTSPNKVKSNQGGHAIPGRNDSTFDQVVSFFTSRLVPTPSPQPFTPTTPTKPPSKPSKTKLPSQKPPSKETKPPSKPSKTKPPSKETKPPSKPSKTKTPTKSEKPPSVGCEDKNEFPFEINVTPKKKGKLVRVMVKVQTKNGKWKTVLSEKGFKNKRTTTTDTECLDPNFCYKFISKCKTAEGSYDLNYGGYKMHFAEFAKVTKNYKFGCKKE